MGLGEGRKILEDFRFKGGRSRYQGGRLYLLDYPGSLVPCMENIMTEERLNEVKAGKLQSGLARYQGSKTMSRITAGKRRELPWVRTGVFSPALLC